MPRRNSALTVWFFLLTRSEITPNRAVKVIVRCPLPGREFSNSSSTDAPTFPSTTIRQTDSIKSGSPEHPRNEQVFSEPIIRRRNNANAPYA